MHHENILTTPYLTTIDNDLLLTINDINPIAVFEKFMIYWLNSNNLFIQISARIFIPNTLISNDYTKKAYYFCFYNKTTHKYRTFGKVNEQPICQTLILHTQKTEYPIIGIIEKHILFTHNTEINCNVAKIPSKILFEILSESFIDFHILLMQNFTQYYSDKIKEFNYEELHRILNINILTNLNDNIQNNKV